MIRITVGACLAASVLTACASLDEMKTNTSNQLRSNVVPLIAECENALFADGVNQQALIEIGLKQSSDKDGNLIFDNGLPKKENGRIIGTGMSLKSSPATGECEFGVGPDGFPETIPDIVRAELISKGFLADDKKRNYTRNGKTIIVSTARSGDYISYYTTTVSFTLK